MIRMEEPYLIGVVVLLILIFMYIAITFKREGFYGEIDTHAKLNKFNEERFNNIGHALNVTGKSSTLGSDTRGIMGNIESTMDARGRAVDRIDNPYSLSGEESPLLKSINMCEKVTASKCTAFDDPKFTNTCGLCMDIGVNSKNNKATGGLLLLPKDRDYAKSNQRGSSLPEYAPTVGSCPAGMFVATKNECERLEKQLQCQKASTFNSPEGCSQCYGDSSYSLVDPKYDADLLRGSGSLYITGLGVLEYQEVGQGNKSVINLSKLSQPFKINLVGGEMTTINLYLKKAIIPVPYDKNTVYNTDDMIIFKGSIYTMIEGANAPGYAPDRETDKLWNKEMAEADYVAPPPNYLAGYLSGATSEESSFTFDLFRLVLTDTLSGRKPRAVGSMNMKNPGGTDDVEVTKMGPIYGKKEMKLVVKSPFTFVDPFSQEASQCAGSPFVTKPESARLLASDSCYKKGAGPGTYGMACLQAMFLNNGCTEEGSGYPKDNNTMTAIMYDLDGKPRNLQDLSDFVYSNAVTTSTGLDSAGKQLTIRKWSEASVFCTGVAITSPCDIGEKDNGPLSTDCLEYLWDNKGENKKQGATYNITSFSRSMFGQGITNRFCTKGGTMSPRFDNGSDNLAAINYWKTKGGVAAVKSLMANIHYDANSSLIPEESKKDKMMQCYGIAPNQRPTFSTEFQSDNSLQTVLKPPFKRKVVVRTPAASGGAGGAGDSGSDTAPSLLVLFHHWTNTTPHILMTTTGKDWFIPNVPITVPSTRIWTTKLGSTYYMACMYESQMLYSSTDGRNWQPMSAAINRFKDHTIVGIVAFKGKLYVAMYHEGLFSSSDAGNTWTHIDIYAGHLIQMKVIRNKLYLVNRYSISEFNPSNNTSKQLSPNFMGGNFTINCLDYDPTTKTYMIICYLADQGDPKAPLFYWSNDVVTWSVSSGNWYTGKYSTFYNLTKAFGKWWATGIDASLLMCSEDGGKSWNEVKAPVNARASLFYFGKTLYYFGMDDPKNQLYITTDGITWQKSGDIDAKLNGGFLFMHSIV
jgi:hypothetical protein